MFPQLAAFDYSVIAVSEDILNGSAPIGNITRSSTMDAMDALYWLRNHSSDLEQLSLQQCLQAYSSEIVSNRGLALLTIYSSKLSIPPHVFALVHPCCSSHRCPSVCLPTGGGIPTTFRPRMIANSP